jgi:hypothetical protein
MDGTEGYLVLGGLYALSPTKFSVWRKQSTDTPINKARPVLGEKYEDVGFGLYQEADAVTLDIADGRGASGIHATHGDAARYVYGG